MNTLLSCSSRSKWNSAMSLKNKAEADKADADAEKREKREKADEDEDENENEDKEEDEEYEKALWTAFQKLKSAKDVTFEFSAFCDAKPHCAVMIAKKDRRQTQGRIVRRDRQQAFPSRRACLPCGKSANSVSRWRSRSPPGQKLQDAIKHHTGKKLPILVGNESADAEEEERPSPLRRRSCRARTWQMRRTSGTAPEIFCTRTSTRLRSGASEVCG